MRPTGRHTHDFDFVLSKEQHEPVGTVIHEQITRVSEEYMLRFNIDIGVGLETPVLQIWRYSDASNWVGGIPRFLNNFK